MGSSVLLCMSAVGTSGNKKLFKSCLICILKKKTKAKRIFVVKEKSSLVLMKLGESQREMK